MTPTPVRKRLTSCRFFKADKVTLHVSRPKEGKLRLVHARLSRTVRCRCYTPDWRVVCERRPFPCHPQRTDRDARVLDCGAGSVRLAPGCDARRPNELWHGLS